MSEELSLKEIKKEWHGTLKAYVIGFVASLLLTSASFVIVLTQLLPQRELIFALAILALVQAVFQLIYFLHVGQEAKPQWETVVFYFMLIILFILVAGSLWITYDLNYRVMPEMKEMSHD